MAEPSLVAPALATPRNGSIHSRRPRPPDLDIAREHENRVPLKAESARMRRRESRLGLINIFGRQKSSVDLASSAAAAGSTTSIATTATSPPLTTPSSSSSSRDLTTPRTAGIRASLAEISHWSRSEASQQQSDQHEHHQHPQQQPPPPPALQQQKRRQRQQGPQSDAPGSHTLTPAPASASATRPARTPASARPRHSSLPAPKPGRGSLATWDPPPLFQAYPQAIRHIELPALTVSAETVLRLHGGRAGQAPPPMPDAEGSSETAGDKARRRHRRNTSSLAFFRSDWTTKIFVLVTSGYLLQYSGEGSFDRLPEKVLHLSKDSAAFASDLIPGRHWVVQVSAAMDADGTSAADSRSLLSRLPFRGSEKRHASAFLMVFEGAEDMDQWIATLRREIEHLGGKKKLSETGKPKPEDNVLQPRVQPSQRALVVRDPARFSRVIAPEQLAWGHESPGPISTAPATPATPETPDILLDSPDLDGTHDQSFDDVSTTNSFASHDGLQLDSLREGSHRLSYVSSGQRTMVTSEGSLSPSCSPTRDSFTSHFDEPPCNNSHPEMLVPEAQFRPSAKPILDRRLPMRATSMSNVQAASRSPPRPLSDCQPDAARPQAPWPLTTPNFSVPHSVGKRFSMVQSSGPTDEAPPARKSAPEPPTRPLPRRRPPPSLGAFSRPLSIVADQPSPMSPRFHCQAFRGRAEEAERGYSLKALPSSPRSPRSPRLAEGWGRQAAEARIQPAVPSQTGLSLRRASMQPMMGAEAPRRSASTQALRSRASDVDLRQQQPQLVISSWSQKSPLPHHVALATKTPERRASRVLAATDMRAQPRTLQRLDFSIHTSAARRLEHKPTTTKSCLSADVDAVDWRTAPHPPPKDLPPLPPMLLQREPEPEPFAAPAPRASTSTQHLRAVSDTKTLLNRHSMSQLADGPPPLPPPTCALPPIPPPMHRGPVVRQARAYTVKT